MEDCTPEQQAQVDRLLAAISGLSVDGSNPLMWSGNSLQVAAGLGRSLIENGYCVLSTQTTELVQRLQTAWRGSASKADLARPGCYSLLITASQPFGEWSKVLLGPAVTIAAINRLVHHSGQRWDERRKPTGDALTPQAKDDPLPSRPGPRQNQPRNASTDPAPTLYDAMPTGRLQMEHTA